MHARLHRRVLKECLVTPYNINVPLKHNSGITVTCELDGSGASYFLTALINAYKCGLITEKSDLKLVT